MFWQSQSARARLLFWSLLFAVPVTLGVACLEAGKSPVKSANGALAPGAEHSAAKAGDAAFRVVFAGPEGEANEVSELSLVFSRPLRKLDLAQAAPPAIAISPPTPGRWLWVGTRALHFVPETPRLPGSTHYTVTVPGELRALDGTVLGQPYRWEFSTPRLRVVDSEPSPGSRGLEPTTAFTLHFNQPLDPGQLGALTQLSAVHDGKTEQLAFNVERPDPSEPKRMIVRPRRALPIHAQVKLAVSEKLRGGEGPLPMQAAFELAVETYAPLAVEAVTCDQATPHDQCAPGGSWSLSLNNAVPLKDLLAALSVTPAIPLRFDNWTDKSTPVTYLNIAGAFRAGTRYTLRLSPGLKDEHGQALTAGFTRDLVIDDYFPAVEIGVQGRLLDPRGTTEIPIGAINVDHYVLRSAALTPEDALQFSAEHDPIERARRLAALRQVQTRTVRPSAGANRISKELLQTSALLGANGRGPVAIAVEYERSPKDYRSLDTFKIVELSDLAITAKLSPDGSLVWVTRLSSGQPVPKASVRILQSNGEHHYETDADGLARIPATDFRPLFDVEGGDADAVLVAQSGSDWVYEPARDFLARWRMAPTMDLSGQRHTYGMVFTERGIYRPGDEVQVKGILRREQSHGNATPVGDEVQLGLYSPDAEQMTTARVKLSKFGTFAAQLKVPESGHLGAWQIQATGFGDTVYESFDVSEYRPVEFKVGVESERPSYVRGDTARWTTHGDFLFGAPMGKAGVRYTVSRAPSGFEVPNSLGFVTNAAAFHADSEDAALNESELLSQNDKLDDRGALSFSHKLDLPGQYGPELVRAEAEVTDLSRQSVSGSTSAIVHPGQFYLALKQPEDYFVSAPGKLATSVLALSPEGERLAGKNVKVELVSRRWTYARQARSGQDSTLLSKVVDRVVGSCALATTTTPLPCAFDVPEAGYYLLHATAKDRRGNGVEAALAVYATGEHGSSFKDSDQLSLGLKTNKATYQIGETARVLIQSPFAEADALVTVERAGVYHSERHHVRGPAPTIELPISEDLRPNAFVAVHLVRARAIADKLALGAPYRVGYAELRIDPEARRLSVSVRADKADYAPGGLINVDFEVKDKALRPHPAELTVYAVDEGVLSLIGYRVPDPVPVFTAPRPLGVATLESRDRLAHLQLEALDGAMGDEKGRDGGGGGLSPGRRDFRQTAYFSPSVVTDAQGKAHVQFKLPESLTTYRIMAVAVSEADHYGFGAASVTTSKRLMARPALPRFLRAGDRLDAGVVVSAKNFEPGRITVQARATGITLLGDAAQTIDLKRDQSLEVRFPFRADAAGKAQFRFEVSAGAERDVVSLERRIDSPATLEAVALYGAAQGSAEEALGDLSSVRSDVGDLELSVASTALVGLGAGVEQLVQYPYGCTEQLSSLLIPLVPLRDLAKDFKVPLPLDLDKVVPHTIAQIVSRQGGDGGFGLWSSSSPSYPWVSAYALFVLGQAKLHGAAVPNAVLDRGKDYLRRYLAEEAGDQYRLPSAAFVVDVLADLGAPDFGYQERLFERRKELPLFAKALLLHALAVSRAPRRMVDGLRPDVQNALRIANDSAFVAENTGDEYAVVMDSPTRTAALVLRALLAVDPKTPLAAELARGILAQRAGGTWRSTQETSYALLALDAYRKAQEQVVPDFRVKALLGQRTLLDAQFHDRSLNAERARIGLSEISALHAAPLVFEKHGSGTLFYQARLRYAQRTLPTDSVDQGFFVQKGLRPVHESGLKQALASIGDSAPSRVPAGDLVLADLVIVTPSPRDFVVIDDPLPAGFEAVDTHLATSSRSVEQVDSASDSCAECGSEEARDELAAGHTYFEDYSNRELRDDRVLFFVDHMVAGMYHFRYLARASSLGHFVLPATRAFEMYTPETFGRNGATSLSIE